MIHQTLPPNFETRFAAVGCFCEYKGEVLLLQRQLNKSQGGKWGLPGGKVDPGETKEEALAREIWEEIGYRFQDQDKFSFFKSVAVQYPDYNYWYHMYIWRPNRAPIVKINLNEHVAFQWIAPRKALDMPLVMDQDGCIKLYLSL